MTGADVLARDLLARGIRYVTTLSGNGLNPFYEACRQAGLRLVDFRNEQAASFAADAGARLSGQLRVCAVSSAGAHVNALVGVMNAWFDGSPVLLISGQSASARRDGGSFQDIDQVALAAPLCKYARYVDRADRILFYLSEAIGRATAGRPGPVHLTIPIDVLEAEAPPVDFRQVSLSRTQVPPLAAPNRDQILDAAEMLAAAERPIIVAGSGVFYAEAGEALRIVAEGASIPVVVPIWDRGAIDEPSEWFLGVVGAASGGPRLLRHADLVLLVGARVDYRIGYARPPVLAPRAKIVRIDADPAELRQGVEPDVAILASPAPALTALAATATHLGLRPSAYWLDYARQLDREFRAPFTGPVPPAPPMTGRHIVEAIRPFLTEDCLFLIDGGNIGQWAQQVIHDRYPSNWLTCGASGIIGWGIAGAIAAKIEHPDRPVILLSGDGSIGFGLAELETAVRQKTPFVAIVADDQAWGIVATGQRQRYGPEGEVASHLGPVAYDVVARGFGAEGVRVERPEDIEPAIRQGLASGKPTLIQVPIAVGGPGEV